VFRVSLIFPPRGEEVLKALEVALDPSLETLDRSPHAAFVLADYQ
jgi:hypothetical protein